MREEIIGDCRRMTAIYALCDPDFTPRYVGKTSDWIHKRHKAHIREAKNGRKNLPVYRWMRKRIAANDPLVIKLLEYVPPDGDWAARERHWIETLRSDGADLLNLTLGGEGLRGHKKSAETRAKIASALRTGATFHCETCGTAFWRRRRDILKGDCRFCTRNCYAASLRGKPKAIPPKCTERGVAAAAAMKRARTHCPSGHEWDAENTRLNKKGARVCRSCTRLAKAKYLAKIEARNGTS